MSIQTPPAPGSTSSQGGIAGVFDRVAATYETVGPPFFDAFGSLLVEATDVRPGDRVVDVAAGSGAVTVPALARAGAGGAVWAVDAAAGMQERLAARLASTRHADAVAVLGDAARLDRPDAQADVVLCGFALFFLPDPLAALREWFRVLRPGGRLGISTWGPENRVFTAVRAAVAKLGVDSRPRPGMFDEPHLLRHAVCATGYTGAAVTTVSVDMVLDDVDALMLWLGSHGARGWLDSLPPGGRESVRARLLDSLPGPVPMTWQAHLATAARPGPH